MNKLILDCPTLDYVKEIVSSSEHHEIELTLENKKDMIEELLIMSYLINGLGYSCEKFTPVDDTKNKFVIIFKKIN